MRSSGILALVIASCLITTSCADFFTQRTSRAEETEPRVVTSLLGEPLPPLSVDPAADARAKSALEYASAHPEDPDTWITYGRLLGTAMRFSDAVAVFEESVARFPDDPRMWRHLGHRRITVRRIDEAIVALERAAALVASRPDEPEPSTREGAPVIDTLKQNVFYHLGLAHFLRGDFVPAEAAFRRCLEFSNNLDARCSASHWLYSTLKRQGDGPGASAVLDALPPVLEVLEYVAYRDLIRLYRGELDGDAHFATLDPKTVDFATFGFGLGNLRLAAGDEAGATAVFRRCLEAQNWAAFGVIGSEAELARLRG
jgi:tetratricopeptide (TPR) repeat protein